MTTTAWVLIILLVRNTIMVPGIASEADCYALARRIITTEVSPPDLKQAKPRCYQYPIISDK